ncbi:MAG TPA: sigma-70 family RNA polymerase sigma factor [Polyangiaceae bacterium]|nr:sigma-70 family RNA polymerase sigma factor [Polyangiaceae bacterium]
MLNRSGLPALYAPGGATGGHARQRLGPEAPEFREVGGSVSGERDPADTRADEVAERRADSLPPLPPAWFRHYFDLLWRLVARLGVPAHSVDDVVQETFITASRRRADIAEGCERRFLMGTAVRLCSNYRQRAHVRREVSHAEPAEPPEHTRALEHDASLVPDAEQLLEEKRLRELLENILAGLSDAHRDVFVLYELEGLSVPEIAELTGIPAGTVASRLARARAKFSEAVLRLQNSGKHAQKLSPPDSKQP